MRPAAGRVAKGAPLELTVNGKGCHSFGFTQKGSLQHKSSRYCVQTAGKVSFYIYTVKPAIVLRFFCLEMFIESRKFFSKQINLSNKDKILFSPL